MDLNETESYCLELICEKYPGNIVKMELLYEALIKSGSTEKALRIAEGLTRLRPGSRAGISEIGIRSALDKSRKVGG